MPEWLFYSIIGIVLVCGLLWYVTSGLFYLAGNAAQNAKLASDFIEGALQDPRKEEAAGQKTAGK